MFMTLAVHLSSFRFTWIVYLAFTKLHSMTLVLISAHFLLRNQNTRANHE